MSRLTPFFAAALLAFALGGCGQQGPLYLPQPETGPEEEEEEKTAAALTPAAKAPASAVR